MHYNDSLAHILRLFGLERPLLLSGLAILLLWAGVFLLVRDRLRALLWAFGVLLVFLPTVHPWYWSLIAPFAAAAASPAFIIIQAAAVFTFPVLAAEYQTGVFQEIFYLKIFEYAPFFATLAFSAFSGKTGHWGRRQAPVSEISVIIPVFNEAGHIRACAASVKGAPPVVQCIAADGGSTDQTRKIARRAGCEVVYAPKGRGRGRQISAAFHRVRGEAVVILHADARMQKGLGEKIIKALNKDPFAVGGAVAMAFDDSSWKNRLIAGLNNLRARLTGIAFGDQAQFARTSVIKEMGGFPDQMLMEDVAFSLDLKARGRVIFLGGGRVRVSARRWRKSIFLRRFFQVLTLFVGYLFKSRFISPKKISKAYYRRYYSSKQGAICKPAPEKEMGKRKI